MKRVLAVTLPDSVAGHLEVLAEREYRRPRDQAAVLLIEAIERRSREPQERAILEPTSEAPHR